LKNLVFIALAGSFGALSRYGITLLSQKFFGKDFPSGTLIANVAGCFLMGVLLQTPQSWVDLPYNVRLGLGVGFLGSLTTFSTFGMDTFKLLEGDQIFLGLTNILANLTIGLCACGVGLYIGKRAFSNF
jgi:CrcB protein